MKNKKTHWYDYFWIWTIIYFALGFFNILFAWLGMFDFLVPLMFAIFGGNKWFCNHMCGRSAADPAAEEASLLPPESNARLDGFKAFPLWFPDLLPDHVRQYPVSDLEGFRRGNPSPVHQAFLDIPGSLELGLYSRFGA